MNPSTSPMRILAIDPGTRYLGLAVFEGERLLDWRVKRATAPHQRRGVRLTERVEAILRPILERYEPQILVLKQGSASQRSQSRMLPMITKHFQTVGKRRGLRVQTYPPEQVRRLFARGRRVTRLEVARILVAEHYPFLAPWYELERRTPWFQESYHLRMFGAVALGVVASRDAACLSASRR
jgi:hypothetical protein